jgi:chromosome segregation ATPase
MDDVQKVVRKAKETVERLETELAKATDRATELQTERRKKSFAAHNGDVSAKKELDKLNAQSTTIAFEIENFNSSIEEARRQLAEAERGGRHGHTADARKAGEGNCGARRRPRPDDRCRGCCTL